MSTTTQTTKTLKGGEWLIKESTPSETYIPEDFNEEQKMVLEMCNSFLDTEVSPNLGDGLTDQAAAVWDFEGTELATTSIPSVNLTP